MAKIDLVAEVLRRDDHEIIEFLAGEAKAIRATFIGATKTDHPEKIYAIAADLMLLTSVLAELDRRNKERGLQ